MRSPVVLNDVDLVGVSRATLWISAIFDKSNSSQKDLLQQVVLLVQTRNDGEPPEDDVRCLETMITSREKSSTRGPYALLF